MKKFFTFILGIIVTLFLSIIPASANSAVRKWRPSGAQGIYLVSDNPIDVKKENLTFDLGVDENYVTAEYTLYNDSNSDIEAELLFPIGALIDDDLNFNFYHPTVSLNNTNLDISVRILYSKGSLIDDLAKLNDNYIETELDNKKIYKCTINENYDEYRVVINNGYEAFTEKEIFFTEDKVFFIAANEEVVPTVEVTVSGNKTLEANVEESTKYEAVKNKNIKNFGEDIYDYYSDIDLYNFSFYHDRYSYDSFYSVINYKIAIPAKTEVINKVKTDLYPGIDTSYTPYVTTFNYMLSPASTFKSFEDLTITINTDGMYLVSNNIKIKKVNNNKYTYQKQFSSLPDLDIVLKTCSVFNPSHPVKLAVLVARVLLGVFFSCIAIILIAGLIVQIIIPLKKKFMSLAYLQVVENGLIALACGSLIINFLIEGNTFMFVAIGLIVAALTARLVGIILINRKYFKKYTWIFDIVIMVIDIIIILALALGNTSLALGNTSDLVALGMLLLLIEFIINVVYTFIKRKFYIEPNKEEANTKIE